MPKLTKRLKTDYQSANKPRGKTSFKEYQEEVPTETHTSQLRRKYYGDRV